MEFNIEGGYRWYLRNSDLSSFDISPNSRLSHAFTVKGINFVAWDQISVAVDPTGQAEISGGGGLLNFRRFNNSAGLIASLRPFEKTTLTANYSFTTDRSITEQFTNLDRNVHTFGTGAYVQLSPRWTTGLDAQYAVTRYQENVQNDGESFQIGPLAIYRPTKHLYFRGSLAYQFLNFDPTGTIVDVGNTEALVYDLAANHTINKRWTQSAHVRKFVGPGVGSNFSDILSFQYGLNHVWAKKMTLNGRLAYEKITPSGITSKSDRVLATIATSAQLSKDWTTGLRYSYAFKDAEVNVQDYQQHRVTLELNRLF